MAIREPSTEENQQGLLYEQSRLVKNLQLYSEVRETYIGIPSSTEGVRLLIGAGVDACTRA
jgi:hypothetical protein